MESRWNKDIASLGVGAIFRLYNAEYRILDIKKKNVRLECTAILNSSRHSLLSVGAKLWKTSPLAVYGDEHFEVISIPEKPDNTPKPKLTLGDEFVAIGSSEDPYKDAPLSKVAARKKRK